MAMSALSREDIAVATATPPFLRASGLRAPSNLSRGRPDAQTRYHPRTPRAAFLDDRQISTSDTED
jgi:hypothetical protein